MERLEKFVERENHLREITVPVQYWEKRINQSPSPVLKMRNAKSIEKNILSGSHFLEQLRIEKLRADRSRAPLSLILFEFSQKNTGENRLFVRNLLSLMIKDTRETDVKGWVTSAIMGLLLPNTDERGAHYCAERILKGNKSALLSVIMSTYPDDIYQQLLDMNQRVTVRETVRG